MLTETMLLLLVNLNTRLTFKKFPNSMSFEKLQL